MGKFVHLHSHTEYSLLDGMSKISKLAKAAKEMGMEALAITDHGAMYGAIEFYKACTANNVKPLIGCELYVAPRSHTSKEGKVDTEPFHLTVLAENYQGYQNLMRLVSVSYLDGFYYKPRVDKELLSQYHEGLICLSGCPAGEFIRSLDEENTAKAEAVARRYLEIFGEGNYFFELQNHHYDQLLLKGTLDEVARRDLEHMSRVQGLTWEVVKHLSSKMGVPIVATNDFHYIKEDDAEAQDALVCVATGKYISDFNRLRMITTPNLYLKSPEEMAESFKDLPQALETSVKIADRCSLEITLGKAHFPVFVLPEGKTSSGGYLRELAYEGAKKKTDLSEEVKTRLEYELGVIEKKHYSDYILVVYDFVHWAQGRGVITNTRGSASGSLVLYCLGVTNSNPLEYLLPFERFLTVFRPSLPDIDVDLADDRRDDIIRYVMRRYGEDKVSHIVTFGTMMGRAAVRDIGRVLEVPYGEVDRIAKLIPPPHQGFHTPIKEAIHQVPELGELYRTDLVVKKLLDLAQKVEGSVRHASVHAAGIVISPGPLTDYTPIQREANGDKIVAQYDMFSVGEDGVGLVKMDLLGIRNLSILGRAVEYVKQNRQIKVDLDRLSLEDAKTYELLSRGETMGLFQLEGSGMTRYLVELKPTNIFDIMAMIALYRPGPLSIIPEYIARKRDPSRIEYFDPRMKEYLERSLGLLVYQDDVLLTAIQIAGYSWEEADKFRKAMGKKIPEEMRKQKDHFISGAAANGMDEGRAEELFKLIEPFAAYGFNKAHAASYGMISYQTAYMKANFPEEFMAAVMTAEYGDTDKIAMAVSECQKMGIKILPPDVNHSGVGFTIEKVSGEERQGIRFGLSAIKNVGIGATESIIKACQVKPFTDILDLCSRIDTRLANRKTLESLIKAGALDSFGSRSAQLAVLDSCLEQVHREARNVSSGQVSLFGDGGTEVAEGRFTLPAVAEMPLEEILKLEKELLGFYLHEPAYMRQLKMLNQYTSLQVRDLTENDLQRKVKLGGVVTEVKKVFTKKSQAEMAFLRMFDGSGEIECVIFPKTYSLFKEVLTKEAVLLLSGKIDNREDKYSLVVDEVEVFDEAESIPKPSFVSVEVEIDQPSKEVLRQVNSVLRQFPGNSPISVILSDGKKHRKMKLQFGVNPQTELQFEIEQILGKGSIRYIE